jgi:hypothetical protein
MARIKVFKNEMGCHLGDMLVFVSAGLRWSERTGKPVYLETPRSDRGALGSTMIDEIAAVINSTGTVIASQETPTESFGNLWLKLRLMPTRERWIYGPYNRAAVQFDGRTMPEKNPPEADLPIIMEAIAEHAQPTKVGLPLTISESVHILARSDFFVGCASGLALLAWMVGLPVYYVEYGMKVDPYITGGQPYIKCYRTEGLRAALDHFEGGIGPSKPTWQPHLFELKGRW